MKFPKFTDRRIAAFALILIATLLIAANPSFTSFLSTQFGVTGNQVGIKPNALLTNSNFRGDIGLEDITLTADTVLELQPDYIALTDVIGQYTWFKHTNSTDGLRLEDAVIYQRTNFTIGGRVSANVVNASIVEVTNGTVNTLRIKTTNGNFIAMSGQPTVLTYTGSGGAANTNVTIDCSTNSAFILFATNNIFLSAINLAIGQQLYLDIVQDATGSRLLTLDWTKFRTNNAAGLPALSTAAGSQDVLSLKPGPYGTNLQFVLTKAL